MLAREGHIDPEWMIMVQAQARELLNQKESENGVSRPLGAATHRLAAALDRLENSVKHVRPNSGGQEEAERFQRENEELRREREALGAAMSQLQTRYDDLHLIADAVYVKLDASIKRLTKVIEG